MNPALKESSILRLWISETQAVAASEFALVFPVLFVMLLGVYDVGHGIMVNQRVISAAHIIADLVARNKEVNDEILDAAITGGELAITPFSIETMGIDIASLEFDEDDNPEVIWRETRNMDPNDDVPTNADGLGTYGEGALVVTVRYLYQPAFAGIVIDNIQMEEVAFIRGRKTSVISHADIDDEE